MVDKHYKSEVYYKKVGRRYVPVAQYNEHIIDSFTEGAHLVVCKPGSMMRRYDIDPEHAPLIAAGIAAENAISKKIMELSQIQTVKTPLTVKQKEAWDNLRNELGQDGYLLQWPSARECATEAVAALRKEAEELLKYQSVRKAYDHFILMCKLTKEENNV